MPYKLEGTWQPADYAPEETYFLRSYQKRHNLKRWLSSRPPEETEIYRLEKEQEDRKRVESNIALREHEMNKKSDREQRMWNRERIREEEREKEQEIEIENKEQRNRNLRSATQFHRATSSEKIQAHMKLEQEAERKANEKEGTQRKEERIAKFEAMVKAEPDRWTEELVLANAAAGYPYDETFEARLGLGLVHRYGCMPHTYTSTFRHRRCVDCTEHQDIARI